MFTGGVARQSNRLYVVRMTVKLAYCQVQFKSGTNNVCYQFDIVTKLMKQYLNFF